MTAFLYTWNPNRWTWTTLKEDVFQVKNGELIDFFWSCGMTKKINIGDVFFLLRLGVEPKGIVGCGYITSEPYYLPHWDKAKAAEGKINLRTDILFKVLSEEPIFPLQFLQDKYPEYNWTPQAGGLSIPDGIASELLQIVSASPTLGSKILREKVIRLYTEGKSQKITIKTYDRSHEARQVCIEYYGYSCSVCGFNFEKTYGMLGHNFIEVHHLKPISDIDEDYLINPVIDLRPVCSNCHQMLHKFTPPISIQELKKHFQLNSLSKFSGLS